MGLMLIDFLHRVELVWIQASYWLVSERHTQSVSLRLMMMMFLAAHVFVCFWKPWFMLICSASPLLAHHGAPTRAMSYLRITSRMASRLWGCYTPENTDIGSKLNSRGKCLCGYYRHTPLSPLNPEANITRLTHKPAYSISTLVKYMENLMLDNKLLLHTDILWH